MTSGFNFMIPIDNARIHVELAEVGEVSVWSAQMWIDDKLVWSAPDLIKTPLSGREPYIQSLLALVTLLSVFHLGGVPEVADWLKEHQEGAQAAYEALLREYLALTQGEKESDV